MVGAGFYVNDWLENRPHKETGFWGIPLGARPADVKFIKGEHGEHSSEKRWAYNTDGTLYAISFRDGKVRVIAAFESVSYNPTTLQGINFNSSFEDVIEKFGQPSYVSVSKDELRRWFSFAKFNVAVAMEKNGVEALAVYEASTGPIKFSDDSNASKGKPWEEYQNRPSAPLFDPDPPEK